MIQMNPSPTFTQGRERRTVDDTNEPLPHLHSYCASEPLEIAREVLRILQVSPSPHN